MNTFNSYTTNNSTVNDEVHDMVTNSGHSSVNKGDDKPLVEPTPELDGGSNWELLGCLIYVFGIIAVFVLLIWSTM